MTVIQAARLLLRELMDADRMAELGGWLPRVHRIITRAECDGGGG